LEYVSLNRKVLKMFLEKLEQIAVNLENSWKLRDPHSGIEDQVKGIRFLVKKEKNKEEGAQKAVPEILDEIYDVLYEYISHEDLNICYSHIRRILTESGASDE